MFERELRKFENRQIITSKNIRALMKRRKGGITYEEKDFNANDFTDINFGIGRL